MRTSVQWKNPIRMECLINHHDVSVRLEYLPTERSIRLPGNSRRKTVRFGIVVQMMSQKLLALCLCCHGVRNELVGRIRDGALRCGLSDRRRSRFDVESGASGIRRIVITANV